MQYGRKAVWSIPYVSVAFFPSLKQNFIAYHSSKVSSHPDYIFEIHQLWQSGFSRVYSNCCCSCSFEAEICQSSHKMCSNNILNFQESTTSLNAWTKTSGNLLNAPCIYIYIYSHPQADCVIVSQLFSVARHIGCLKLGSKHAQLYIRLSIILFSLQVNLHQLGCYKALCSSFCLFTFSSPDTRVLNSFEELFCQHIFLFILSSHHNNFMPSCRNWFINLT